MRPLTIYVADDGSRWDDEAEALKRDELIAEFNAFLDEIGFVTEKSLGIECCGYANGDGFIQQPDAVRDRLLKWAVDRGWNRDSDGPVGKAASLAYRIDNLDRMWGQQYYALTQDGKARCLNPSEAHPMSAGTAVRVKREERDRFVWEFASWNTGSTDSMGKTDRTGIVTTGHGIARLYLGWWYPRGVGAGIEQARQVLYVGVVVGGRMRELREERTPSRAITETGAVRIAKRWIRTLAEPTP